MTSSVIADDVAHIKQDKTDPIFNFSSDCFKNAPGILYDQLAAISRGFLLHGHISSVLLLATLVPIVKDKLGNICSSDNYRSIAISSLILKIFDWVIILLYGDKLGLDELQFSYQPNISTNMCTWMAIETIDYFTRNGSDVYVCTMDMSKAFDKVRHSLLFKKLVCKGLPETYSRLLIVMYRGQSANVRWNNTFSKQFPLSNGVKQSAVLSAILFCVYLNDLNKLLRRRRSGCWVNGEFNGICGYSDDILLLAPCIDALQDMLSTCEKYAQEHNLQFSTNINPIKSKTKCMAFVKRKGLVLKEMVLCNNNLPWVNSIKHLGCVLTNSSDIMSGDVMFKRAVYVNRNNELCQEFYFTDPNLKIQINNLFNTSFYGSVFWDLFGAEVSRLEKTWNVSLRKMLNIPRQTHRFFLEPLSKTSHIIFSLCARFVKFVNKIRSCNKPSMINLLNTVMYDCQSTTGSNIRNILLKLRKTPIDEIRLSDIRNLRYFEIPNGSEWKIIIVKKCIDNTTGFLNVPGFNRSEIEEIRDYICVT